MNAAAGDRRGWHELRVPSVQAEDDRQLQREWDAVREDHTRVRNRIHGLLATQGVRVKLTADFLEQLRGAQLWDGTLLPAELVARLERDWTQLQHVDDRLTRLKELRQARVAPDRTDVVATQTRHLAELKGIGVNSALTLSTELFAWRGFANGREVGAIIGLTPSPYRSDQRMVEQGISRAGNRRVRALAHALVPSALRQTRPCATNRHGRGRSETDDRVVAACRNRHTTGRRRSEGVTRDVDHVDVCLSWGAPLVPPPGFCGNRPKRWSGAPLQSPRVD